MKLTLAHSDASWMSVCPPDNSINSQKTCIAYSHLAFSDQSSMQPLKHQLTKTKMHACLLFVLIIETWFSTILQSTFTVIHVLEPRKAAVGVFHVFVSATYMTQVSCSQVSYFSQMPTFDHGGQNSCCIFFLELILTYVVKTILRNMKLPWQKLDVFFGRPQKADTF